MSNIIVALIAYSVDRIFGEFSFIKHPIIIIGSAISWFEKRFYQDRVLRGALLLIFIVTLTGGLAYVLAEILAYLPWWLDTILTAVIASMFLAHKMLRDAVLELTTTKDPKEKLAMLVSRDTSDLSNSDICKAAVETYAENLSDGVIAPLFYLLIFGLPGIIIYKSINTLDSMVGYRNERYERYGKASALMDDVVNFIPARLTAMMIMVVSRPKDLFAFYAQGSKHASPNAGHTIAAMALAIGVRLGGPTRYFGELKDKVFFGEGRVLITNDDIEKSLKVGLIIDFLVVLLLFLGTLYAVYS